MWNQFNTGTYSGMLSETIALPGYQGDKIHAYFSRPLGKGPFPAMVLIPHAPGWDEWCWETARRFSQHGYLTICPDIYHRLGEGTPEEVAQVAREQGLSDASVMGDTKASLDYLSTHPTSSGKVGVIGMCSGGRHAFLAACTIEGFDAAVDCWGGGVVMTEDQLTPLRPVAPIDLTEQLSCPLLGIFGEEDKSPTPEQVDLHEERLKQYGKDYTFYRYEDAGHGIWYYHNDRYRPLQAMDSWDKALAFLETHLK